MCPIQGPNLGARAAHFLVPGPGLTLKKRAVFRSTFLLIRKNCSFISSRYRDTADLTVSTFILLAAFQAQKKHSGMHSSLSKDEIAEVLIRRKK
jgi:hypothetical protein